MKEGTDVTDQHLDDTNNYTAINQLIQDEQLTVHGVEVAEDENDDDSGDEDQEEEAWMEQDAQLQREQQQLQAQKTAYLENMMYLNQLGSVQEELAHEGSDRYEGQEYKEPVQYNEPSPDQYVDYAQNNQYLDQNVNQLNTDMETSIQYQNLAAAASSPGQTMNREKRQPLKQVKQLTELQYNQILRKTMILDKVDRRKKEIDLKYEIEELKKLRNKDINDIKILKVELLKLQ